MKTPYFALLAATLLAACANPNARQFQGSPYTLETAELTGGVSHYQYADARNPHRMILVEQVRNAPADYTQQRIAKEKIYRRGSCTLQPRQTEGVSYHICRFPNGKPTLVYTVSRNGTTGYTKVFIDADGISDTQQQQIAKDLQHFSK